MKKLLLGISGLAVLVFVLVLTVGAQDKTTKDKELTQTEVVTEASHCGSSSACMDQAETHKADCDHENCDPENCDENCTGKCDHKQCTGNCTVACEPEKCHSAEK
ncbi:MAG: hypothetical protein RQ743_10500 [Bacteroidales bacterium]|nr:hypothetical protein [Bacteroidales bacterium]